MTRPVCEQTVERVPIACTGCHKPAHAVRVTLTALGTSAVWLKLPPGWFRLEQTVEPHCRCPRCLAWVRP